MYLTNFGKSVAFIETRGKPFEVYLVIYSCKMKIWVIFRCIQKWFAPFGPDFYAISKMVHEISVRQKLPKLQAIFHFQLIWLICGGFLLKSL